MLVISLAVLFSACDAKISQERSSPLAELFLAYNPTSGLVASRVARSKIPHMIGEDLISYDDEEREPTILPGGRVVEYADDFADDEYDDYSSGTFEDEDWGAFGESNSEGYGGSDDDDEAEKEGLTLFEIPDDEIRALLVDDDSQEQKRQSLKNRYEAWDLSMRGLKDELGQTTTVEENEQEGQAGNDDSDDDDDDEGPINTGPEANFANRQAIVSLQDKFRLHPADVGSVPVQIAALTARIRIGTEHLRKNRKDFASRRGIEMLVNKRRKLLEHVLAQKDVKTFMALCDELGIAKDPFFLERSGARGRDRAIALKKAQEEELDFKF
jgi:small subunit ribosomal protein S15